MIEAGIMPDDLVLVRKQNMAQTGETIVAMVEDEATVKNLRRRGNDYYLEPANPNYRPILVDQKVSIIGKVISVVRRF
jgi:repressor LexA